MKRAGVIGLVVWLVAAAFLAGKQLAEDREVQHNFDLTRDMLAVREAEVRKRRWTFWTYDNGGVMPYPGWGVYLISFLALLLFPAALLIDSLIGR